MQTPHFESTLCRLLKVSRVFQIALRGGRETPPVGRSCKFCWQDFFNGWLKPEEEWFWSCKPFSKIKATFCKYWTSIKIKIGMTCVYKEYKVKIKMVQEQMATAKNDFFWIITWKLLFSGAGINVLLEGGWIKILWEESTKGDFQVES